MQHINEKPLTILNRECNRNDAKTTFIWRVKNFDMCPDKWGKNLKSPTFSVYNWQDPKFQLLLYAGGVNEKSSKYISLYIYNTCAGDENYTYSGKLGIVTSKDKKTYFEFCQKFHQGNGNGLAEFFEKKKFQSSEREIFLPHGHLTMFCEIEALDSEKPMSIGINSQLKKLSVIYTDIFKNEKFCDVFLHVGEKTFKVHKVMIEARFPDLLKNMDGNKCKIKGIGFLTMNAVLHYVYTGLLNFNEINLFEILSSNYVLPSHLKYLLLEKQNKIEATTCFQKTVMSFSWVIQNFSSLDSGKIFHYPLIGDYDLKWTWLDLFISVTTDEDYITISIQRFSKDCRRIVCTIKTSDVSESFDHTYDKEDKWTLPNFFTKDMLKSTSMSGEKIMNFDIAVSDGTKTNELEKKELILHSGSTNQTAEDLNSFRKDLLNILSAPKFCDITLTSGKNKFPAHKFILSARSSVFCDMLQSESAKKKNTEITIDDLDASVIKDMLSYMYCDEVKFSLPGTKHIHSMYSASSKYDLPELKKECVNFLKSNLNAETAADILISAHTWNDEELKELVYNFVCTYPLEIANCKEWEQVMLKRSDLALEVLNKTLSYLAAKNKIINIETD